MYAPECFPIEISDDLGGNQEADTGRPSDVSPPESSDARADGPMIESDIGQDSFTHPTLPHRLLKHIPKGARAQTGRLLINIINKILNDAENPNRWQMLLNFGAAILEQPIKGGRRHNLTSTIKKRVDHFPPPGRSRGKK